VLCKSSFHGVVVRFAIKAIQQFLQPKFKTKQSSIIGENRKHYNITYSYRKSNLRI